MPAGAVDLGALKQRQQRPEISEEEKLEAIRGMLRQAGLLCSCGDQIRDRGRVVIIVRREMIPDEQYGGMTEGVQMITMTVCSPECDEFSKAVEAQGALAIKHLTPIEWIEAEEDSASGPTAEEISEKASELIDAERAEPPTP